MPSHSINNLGDLEEIMCKNLLRLDLRDPSGQPPHLSLNTGMSAFTSELCRNAFLSHSSLPCLSNEPRDDQFLPSARWVQRAESPLLPLPDDSKPWAKSGFFSQRSVSMVETSSTQAARAGWPDEKFSQSDMNDTLALNSSCSSSASSISSASSLSRYKTELCRSYTESGLCKYGLKCQFAHGPTELRDLSRHPKYKTEPCRTFHTIGFCPYGIRCHFVHNADEVKRPLYSRSSSSDISQQRLSIKCSKRPPLVRQSFSFAGFPSAPQAPLTGHTPPVTASFSQAPSDSPPSCADITDFLSHVFMEVDNASEPSPAPFHQPANGQTPPADPRSSFLPSPDSGYSPCGLSPTGSPSLRQSPGAVGVPPGPMGARSTSSASLSDQDQDAGSSSSSFSGSESGSANESSGKRLAVFSQLSVPEDATASSL